MGGDRASPPKILKIDTALIKKCPVIFLAFPQKEFTQFLPKMNFLDRTLITAKSTLKFLRNLLLLRRQDITFDRSSITLLP